MWGGGEEAMPREATTFCKSSITKSGGQGRVEGSKGRRVEGSKGRRVEGSKGRRVPLKKKVILSFKGPADQGSFL